ncbi:hypothetical protein ACIBCT_32965 [Streptosporangium sp. NPDC050855]|uniref:hypothetical protein n=1 Tax=Streptosporangium sp. NPDC050855 TaxID=3366194 RepID=UPI0037A7A59F
MAGEEVLTGAGIETAVLGGMKALGKYGPSWAASLAKIELAGKLAKPAAGAAAVWLLARPWDDEAISKVFNDWRTINLKLSHLRNREWDTKLKAVQAAWPEGDDRAAFDRFMGVVHQEVQQLETAALQMANAVQSAQSDIHKIVNTAGVVVNSLLGIIIASEIAQLIGKQMQAAAAAAGPAAPVIAAQGKALEAAAKATQASSGLILMGTAVNTIVGITASLLFSMGNLTSLMSMDNQFPMAQANLDSDGTDGRTDFDDITRRSVSRSSEGWSYG